jgi:hypothetical protein
MGPATGVAQLRHSETDIRIQMSRSLQRVSLRVTMSAHQSDLRPALDPAEMRMSALGH